MGRVAGGRRRCVVAGAVTHAVLVAGAVLFSLPFLWLLLTSVKADDEMFTKPMRWFPTLPPKVVSSPFPLPELMHPVPTAPEGVDRADFAAKFPAVEEALWERAYALLSRDELKQPMLSRMDAAALREALVRALWHETHVTVPPSAWSGPKERLVEAFLRETGPATVELAWERAVKRVAVGKVRVQDMLLRESMVEPEGGLAAWRAEGGASLVDDSFRGLAFRTLLYELPAVGDSVRLSAQMRLPFPAEDLRAVNLPLRCDGSHYPARVRIETSRGVYVGRKPYTMGDKGWAETVWQFEEEPPDRRTRYILMERVGGSEITDDRLLRITVEFTRRRWTGACLSKLAHHYTEVLTRQAYFWRYVYNSLKLVVLCVTGQVLSCSLVAYSFARLRWPGRNLFFVVLLSTMMLPGQVTMIPGFLIWRWLGAYDTLFPLWLPSFLGSAFFIFLLRQFLLGVPTDLEDAAKIDGCSHLGIWWRIMLPLTKPALATVGIFTFMASWNDFIGPLIYLTTKSKFPLSLGLWTLHQAASTNYGGLMAASMLMTLPVIALFFLGQRHFIQGITLTGMKG